MKRYAFALLLALAALPARADFAFPSVRVDWGTTPPTSCRPVEIFVDTDADTDGAVCICRAVDTWKCGPTADYEEEAHAAEHAENGADELLAEALGTACSDGEILKANASGGVICGTAGSASFTTLDADYGDETVTSTWNLGGALLELPNSTAPTGTDCDDAAEAGRVHIDTNAGSGQQVYVCEGVTGWVQQGGDPTGNAPYGDYDPDNPPASGLDAACSDEFLPSGSTGTWRWGNQGSATLTLGAGAALLVGDGNTTEKRVRWCTVPVGSWVYTVKLSHIHDGSAATRERCGLAMLRTGTEGTPTLIDTVFSDFPSTTTAQILWATDDNYNEASGASVVATLQPTTAGNMFAAGIGMCFQMRYDTTANTLQGCYAADCVNWRCAAAVGSITADPVSLGFFVIENSTCAVRWTRLCTSGACMSAPFPPGE